MDVESFVILAGLGAVIALATAVVLLIIWFLLYSQFLASRLVYYSADVIDPMVPIYTAWFTSAVVDVGGFIAMSFSSFKTRVTDEFITRLPLLLGLALLSFGAMVATEYHDSGAEIVMNVYQCFVRWIFYDLSVMRLLNIARVLYDIVWPFDRFAAEEIRYATRTWLTEGLICSKDEIFTGFGRVGSGAILILQALSDYVTNLVSLDAETLPDFTPAYVVITRGIADTLLRIGDCICAQIDFIFIILFQWIKSAPTASLLNHASQLGTGFLRLIPRTITGTHPGTIPGQTANYGYVPNFEFVFDLLCLMVHDIADLLNYELFVIVSEIVGKADPALFVPGSPEAVVLAFDWFGFLGHTACAGIEVARWIYHVVWSIVLVVVAVFYKLADSLSPSNINPPVPVFCDLREWRALYDFGGLTGLMRKPNGGIEGELQLGFDRLDALFNAASPIARKLVVPPFRSASTLVFGTLNFIARFIFHAFDSEFRMFSPVLPPRTGFPVSDWTPPTALPPNPILDCDGFVPVRGNVWVWIQHYVNDPHGTVLRFVDAHLTEWAEGWKDLGSLWDPDFGLFLQQIVLFAAYGLDFAVQSLTHINVTFEDAADYALFITVWRYARFFDTFKDIGEGLRGTFERIHEEIPPNVPCSDPEDGFFCALGGVVSAGIRLVDSVLDQIIYFFAQARLEDFEMPNFVLAINDLVLAADAFVVLWAFQVPPIPIQGNPLTLYVQRILSSVVYALSLLLYFPNYVVANFQGVVDVFKAGGTPAAIGTAVGDWFTQILDYFLVELTARFCSKSPDPEGLLYAFAFAFDAFVGATPGSGVWSILADAFCTIFSGLISIFSDFALNVLAAIFEVLGTFLALFFGEDDDFGTRLLNFFTAIGNLFTQLPGLIFDLFLGLLELIPIIGPILSNIIQALVNGLCSGLQGFLNIAVDILNAFGAGLPPVDLGCAKKRRLGHERPGFSPVAKLIVAAMNHTNSTSSLRSRRYAKLKALGKRIEEARSRKRHHAVDNEEDMVDSYRHAPNQTLSISMQEGIQMVTEYVEWSGESFCDKIVLGFAGRNPEDLTLTEKAHYEDCLGKRALGEVIAVLPGMQWFPEDGLYDTFAWLRLGIDGAKALQIYQQYTQDRRMPIEVVLSRTYQTRWEEFGLRTDHLTEENYDYVIFNMTLEDYFERNDGNLDILDALSDAYYILGDAGSRYGTYLQDLAVKVNATKGHARDRIGTELETWLYGSNATDGLRPHHALPRDIEMTQNIWRTLLRLNLIVLNGTKTAIHLAYATDLPMKLANATATIPGAAYNFMQWMGSGSTPEWERVLRERQANLEAHGFNAPIWGHINTSTLFEKLWTWGKERVFTALTHLKPNDARARRNWLIIIQVFVDLRKASETGWLPDRETHERSYTPRYPTGEFTVDPVTGEMVGVLAECDTTVVPFCLDCAILDGLLATTVEAALRFEDYWLTLWPVAIGRYQEIEDYISDDDVNVCGGDGTQAIHWPSDVVVTGNTTVLDIFGQSQGAVVGFIEFASDLLFDEVGALRFTKEQVYAKVSHVFYLDRPDRHQRVRNAFLGGSGPDLPQRRLAINYITNYAQTHTEFDPTYALTQFFDITPVTEVLDDVSNFFVGIDFSFVNDSNPFLTNDTIELPQLNPSVGNEFGFFARLVDDLVVIDYDHNCEEDRNMTLLQGIILFTILGLIIFVVMLGLRECIPETFAVLIGMMTVVLVVGVLFLTVVYGVPVQNTIGMPPVPPHCLAGDAVETTVCDIVPKCPAVVAGLVIGEYSEANCKTCPFEPIFGNCKRNFDVRHGFDVVLLLLELLSRSFMDLVRAEGGLGTIVNPALGLIGIDAFRYATVDFSDKVIFDRSFICIILIGLFSIPVTLLAQQISAIIIVPLLEIGAGIAVRVFEILWAALLTAGAIYRSLHVNLINVSTPLELRAFRRDVRRAGGGTRDPLRVPTKTVGVGQGLRQMAQRADLLVGFSDAWHGREERRIVESGLQLRKRKRRRKKPKPDTENPLVDKKHD